MKIGILGTGNVGGTLGKGWAQKGHTVKFGVRKSGDNKLTTLLKEAGNNASLGTVAEAAGFGEAVVLATPWGAVRDVLRSAGNLNNKVLLDCTNPLKSDLSGLEIGCTTSAGEQVANWSGARVVKIFNTTGASNMAKPKYPAGPLAMFYCGDDAAAKKVAAQLASDLGFTPVDAGGLIAARWLEGVAMLWIHLAIQQHFGTDFGFVVVQR